MLLVGIDWDENCTETLVNALTSRWEATGGAAQLLEFDFHFTLSLYYDFPNPATDTDLVAVRCLELVEQGMKIHLGPPEASWIGLSDN